MELKELIELYNNNTAEINKLNFYNERIKEQVLEALKRTELKPYMPFKEETWSKLIKYVNKDIKRGDADYKSAKAVYSFILDILQDNISPYIVSINKIVNKYGYDFTLVSHLIYFNIGDDEYELQVPVLSNLTIKDIYINGYFSTSSARFSLLRRDLKSMYMWREICNGTNLAKIGEFLKNVEDKE